jgi:hypothetical protein
MKKFSVALVSTLLVSMLSVNAFASTSNTKDSVQVYHNEHVIAQIYADLDTLNDEENDYPVISGAKCYTESTVITNKTIVGDIYIGPEAVLLMTNSTVTGNIYVLGAASLAGVNAKGVYANEFISNSDDSPIYYNGRVYLQSSNSIGVRSTSNYPVKSIPFRLTNNTAYNVDGKLKISGSTLDVADFYINNQKIELDNCHFSINDLEVGTASSINLKWVTVFGNSIIEEIELDKYSIDDNGKYYKQLNYIPNSCTEDGHYEKLVFDLLGGEEVSRETVTIPATGHDWNTEYTIDANATCIDNGSKSIHCKKCDEKKDVQVINALNPSGHEWNDGVIADEATCVRDGRKVYTCNICKLQREEVLPAKGHSEEGEYRIKEAPTCTENGIEVLYCSECGSSLKTRQIDALGHDWDEGQIIDKSTCTVNGSAKYVCKRCNVSETRIVYATGHEWDDEYTIDVPATCKQNGEKSIHCKKCDARKKVSLVMYFGGHKWEQANVIKEATCTENGQKICTCSVCNEQREFVIDALGHDWNDDYFVDKSPNCTEDGEKSIHCKRCSETKDKEAISALGHDWDAGDIIKVATCEGEGEQSYHCTVCGQDKIETIPAAGHVWDSNYTVDKAATCTEDGLESIHCQNCEKTKDSKTIAALGHNWDKGELIKAATCEGEGEQAYHCTVCGQDKIETIPATGHVWNKNYTVDKVATCTEDGLESIHCQNCEKTKDSKTIAALGHNWDKGELIKTATCEGEGEQAYHCTVCGQDKIETIPATGHVWNENYTVDKAATCTEYGLKSIHCKKCAKTEHVTVIPMKNHTAVDDPMIDATCKTTGLTKGSHCSVCGQVIVAQKNIAKKAHVYEKTVSKATVSRNGFVTVKCKNCGVVSSKTVVYHPKTVKISRTNFVYNGRKQTSKITVVGADGKTIASSNYTLRYSAGCTKVGIYKVMIAFKGNYNGSITKTFTIVPKKTKLVSMTPKKGNLIIKWARQIAQVTGYQIQYATKSNFAGAKTITVTKNTIASKTLTKLTSKKKYYVRIRTYKKVSGKNYVSEWSPMKMSVVK